MKTHIIALVISLMTLTAQAGNEGPQAAPAPPPTVIAQVATGGGFGPMPSFTRINILDNGQVEATETTTNLSTNTKTEVTTKVVTLSAPLIKKLVEYIQATTPGKLVFNSPNDPMCADAPSTGYYVIRANGEKIAIAGVEGCKSQTKDPASDYDHNIKRILESIANLYYAL